MFSQRINPHFYFKIVQVFLVDRDKMSSSVLILCCNLSLIPRFSCTCPFLYSWANNTGWYFRYLYLIYWYIFFLNERHDNSPRKPVTLRHFRLCHDANLCSFFLSLVVIQFLIQEFTVPQICIFCHVLRDWNKIKIIRDQIL